MSFRIGFAAEDPISKPADTACATPGPAPAPRPSVVQVYFAKRDMTLAYYNDRFDLHRGDVVYVDGKLEGLRGRVVEVNYTFKIKVSEYKRVIAVADTNVSGRFFMAGSHFITFDRQALPAGKAASWFKAPAGADEVFASGCGDASFRLDRLDGMDIGAAAAERGQDYYRENKVRYLSVDGSKGYAIVEGSKAYEVEFSYRDGEISGLVCPCFCGGRCKHEFAAMLQLRETLELIDAHYAAEWERAGYFASVAKSALFSFAIDGKESGSFLL